MKGLSQALNYGKSVNDNGWGMFRDMLRYKLEDRGKKLIVIDKWFPSTQICSECGCIHPEVKDLSVKEWFCDWCLTYHDRDRNAAINIKHKGMRQLSHQIKNRGARGDSSCNLAGKPALNEKPPPQLQSSRWWE